MYDGEVCSTFPSDIEVTEIVPIPMYKTFEGGWDIDPEMKKYEQLPQKARKFVEFIEFKTGVPVTDLGVGPGTNDTIKHYE